ncbi:AraC family transcriptional regulator [uncultured Winogradskyella sp.]|uniref:helix-turn-helix domain-containing protein n=1 Tax=uncultured Winogradskyella sp. TaxID=395353 RepID=UPI002635DC16|nr:AraC family transcriptional regulator [uncultured Winogradskyella sp.]
MYRNDCYINEFHDFSTIEKLLKGEFINGSKLAFINTNNVIGKGFIKCLKHSNGIVTFNLDLFPYTDIEIPISSTKIDTIQFMYMHEGNVEYSKKDNSLKGTVNKLQTAIIANKAPCISQLKLKKNTRTVFSIISLRKKVYTSLFDKNDDEFSITALKFINDLNKRDRTFIPGDYDLRIAEHFKNYYEQIKDNQNVKYLSAEGSIYHMLANHFRVALNLTEANKIDTKLTFNELKRISDLSDRIKSTPEIQYSINMLSRETSLSPAKLQDGFKLLFNRTVSDFIRHVRLQKAEHLMHTTDFNVSEIVYSIGFTSRSYFCKIFKLEFGCSPKAYKNRIKQLSKTESLIAKISEN